MINSNSQLFSMLLILATGLPIIDYLYSSDCPQVPLCLQHIIPVYLHLDPSPLSAFKFPSFLPCEHRVEQAAMFLHNYGLGMAVSSTVLFDLSIIIPSVLVFSRSNCFRFSGSVRENRLHAFLLQFNPQLSCCHML